MPDPYSVADLDTLRMEEFIAERVSFYVRERLLPYPALSSHAQFQSYSDAVTKDLVYQITSWCLAGKIPSETVTETVEYPDGVWQMFKSLHMPHWFQTRFPVRMRKVKVDKTTNHYFVCPHVVTDETARHVQFMATGSPLAGRIG